ncbi:MAG: pyrroline-5-carboxylate reductase [Candidatus Micrarchaeota archaeon]
MSTIGIIGAGRLGSAFAEAFAKSYKIIVSDPNKENLERFKKIKNIQTTTDNIELATKSDFVLIAVKPKDFDLVVAPIAKALENKLLISFAAAVNINRIESLGIKNVIRVMPNICVSVDEGLLAYSLGKHASTYEKQFLDSFSKIGKCLKMDEKLIDPITVCSGSGPAFIAYFADAIAEEAKSNGLDYELAMQAVAQTLVGTGKLLLSGKRAQEIITQVASPGGVTEEGLKILDKNQVKEKIKESIRFAMKKTIEMGKK